MSQTDEWLLVAPAENAKSARPIPAALVAEYQRTAKDLGLRCTADQAARKLYLGLPAKAAPVATQAGAGKPGGVLYPSGLYLDRHPENNASKYAPGDPSSAAPLVKAPMSSKVSENFTLQEFACHDSSYDGVRVHPDLVKALEKIRAIAGKGVSITSAYRPPAYNASVGGASLSQHLDGLAADIYVLGMSTQRLHQICEQVIGSGGGVGYYPSQGFVHVDVRGYRSRWTG